MRGRARSDTDSVASPANAQADRTGVETGSALRGTARVSVNTGRALEERRRPAEAVVEHIEPGTDVIVGLGNGEPMTVVDAIEHGADALTDVRLHQMLPLRDRRYIEGELAGLTHVSWFLSPHDKAAFHRGACDLVPNNFSEVPNLMRRTLDRPIVVAAVSEPDRHGYFSLGPHAEYVASFIGELPFFVEVNRRMPRTFGENQIHVSEVEGWCEADYPLVELPEHAAKEADRRIAELVAERIPDEATLQAGIGTIPNLVLGMLTDHRHLGVHTELLGDGFVALVECGAVTGTRKRTHRNKLVTTSALGGRAPATTSSPTTPAWSSGRSTTRTTRRPSRGSRACTRSTRRSRSTSSDSAPRSRWGATTGRPPAVRPTSREVP